MRGMGLKRRLGRNTTNLDDRFYFSDGVGWSLSVNIGNFKRALEVARKFFGGTKYQATKEEIKRLTENMILLEKRGLGKVKQRLLEGGRGIWTTFQKQ